MPEFILEITQSILEKFPKQRCLIAVANLEYPHKNNSAPGEEIPNRLPNCRCNLWAEPTGYNHAPTGISC
jgi:hypothetical protein